MSKLMNEGEYCYATDVETYFDFFIHVILKKNQYFENTENTIEKILKILCFLIENRTISAFYIKICK